jgi:hypothetical protein
VTSLRFRVGELLPIIDWARRNPPGNYPYTSDPAPPGLLFVKDEGVYLLANTSARQRQHPSTERVVVCYADTYGPDRDWWEIRAAVGGDDFAEFLPLLDVLSVIKATPADQWFVIDFDPAAAMFTMTTAP